MEENWSEMDPIQKKQCACDIAIARIRLSLATSKWSENQNLCWRGTAQDNVRFNLENLDKDSWQGYFKYV